MEIGNKTLIVLTLAIILSGCYSSNFFDSTESFSPQEVENSNFDYVLKRYEYNDAEIYTMIPIDQLLISNMFSNKYYINLIYKKYHDRSELNLMFIHEGYDLLHISKNEETLFISADSLDKSYKCHKTNRDEETFIYQCFASYGFTVQEERLYYQIDEETLYDIINSNNVAIKLKGKRNSISAKLTEENLSYLNKFYQEVISNYTIIH